jgi:hypothetical protein
MQRSMHGRFREIGLRMFLRRQEPRAGSMTALAILFALAFFALLLSRVHFHFSFNLTISKAQTLRPSSAKTSKGQDGLSGGARRLSFPAQSSRDRDSRERPAIQSIRDAGVQKTLDAARAVAEGEVASALVNLGCKPQKAREVAKKAIEQGKDFESRVRWAIQNAA